MRKLLFVTPSALVLGLLGLFGACSSGALVAAGGECFQAVDCEPGLVCIPSAGKRVCSSDLSGIATVPPEAGGAADAAKPGDATIIYDGAKDALPPPPDQSVPDNNPPPQDSGNDAAPPLDSGSGG